MELVKWLQTEGVENEQEKEKKEDGNDAGLFNPLKPSGHYMYHQYNIQQFHVLPTQCIYVFCVDLRTNSDYLPIQH